MRVPAVVHHRVLAINLDSCRTQSYLERVSAGELTKERLEILSTPMT